MMLLGMFSVPPDPSLGIFSCAQTDRVRKNVVNRVAVRIFAGIFIVNDDFGLGIVRTFMKYA